MAAVLGIPAGEVARERWYALTPDERRTILTDAAAGRAQGMPELARIAAGWARTAADASRHRVNGYRAALLVAVAAGLAAGGLLPPAARAVGVVWLVLVGLIVALATRAEARLRQLYAWVEACNLNYLLWLEQTIRSVGRVAVRYRAPPGRYALLIVGLLVPLGSAIGTGASALTAAVAGMHAVWTATAVARHRRRPLAVLDRDGVHVDGLTVPWSDLRWVFVGVRGRRFALGVHWVLRGPAAVDALVDHAAVPPSRRPRLRRRLTADPRVTVPCLLCHQPPEELVLTSAALRSAPAEPVPS
jgi:hypothetical protein